MRKLTVLYDATCGFCVRCKEWLERQPAFLELECLWAQSPEVQKRFPGVVGGGPAELIVISDEGGVYRGARAWIMCLYALREYREWSLRLARPAFFPLARRAFEVLSKSRGWLTRLLGLGVAEELASVLARPPGTQESGVSVQASASRAARCGYCHDQARADAEACPRCGTLLHKDCKDELGRCPTIGCVGAVE